MTLAEFLTALEQTPRDWHLVDGALRGGRLSNQCPISALENCSIGHYRSVADSLGLDPKLANKIAVIADNDLPKSQLRQDLLRACGLEH